MQIKLLNITKIVKNGSSSRVLLDNLSMEIEKGDFIAIKGKSGAGKTTLLNILGGLVSFQDGSYFFENNDITQYSNKDMARFRRKNIGIVTQQFQLLKDRNVYENIALPLKYDRVNKIEIKDRVEKVLSSVELSNFQHRSIPKLSGGEQQRIAIARAIIQEPRIILADEPTGSLDEEAESNIMNIFSDLNKSGITIIIVTHDDTVAERCNKVFTLKNGNINIDDRPK